MGLWWVCIPISMDLTQLMINDVYSFRQDAFYENYFESQRDHIFRSVELLIYVFDIESREIDVRISISFSFSCSNSVTF